MYKFTLIIAFEGGAVQQTQEEGHNTKEAIASFLAKTNLSEDEDIVSITVAEKKEYPFNV